MQATATVIPNSQYFNEFTGKTIRLKLLNNSEVMYGRFMALSSGNHPKSLYKAHNDVIYFDKITNLDIHKTGSILENYLNYGVVKIEEGQIERVELWSGE